MAGNGTAITISSLRGTPARGSGRNLNSGWRLSKAGKTVLAVSGVPWRCVARNAENGQSARRPASFVQLACQRTVMPLAHRQQFLRLGTLGCAGVELRRRPLLDDPVAGHHRDPAAHMRYNGEVEAHHDACQAAAPANVVQRFRISAYTKGGNMALVSQRFCGCPHGCRIGSLARLGPDCTTAAYHIQAGIGLRHRPASPYIGPYGTSLAQSSGRAPASGSW